MKVWSMVVLLLKREQPARVPSGVYLVVMEWMATITGEHVGFLGISGFFSKEKNFGELSSACRKWKNPF
jgi:hypothetical protein